MLVNIKQSVNACSALLRQLAISRYENIKNQASHTKPPFKILKEIQITSIAHSNVAKSIKKN